MMYCYNCGQDCKDAKFCSNCGVKLGNGVPAEEVFPEAGTAEFEAKRAELERRRIPHCPECLSTHLGLLPWGSNQNAYYKRFVCMWCGYEWDPRHNKRFKNFK